jgi:hypothetical protein
MGLAEAVLKIIETLRGRRDAGDNGPDNWERMVGIIADQGTLPNYEVKVIEKAIDQAYRGWTDAKRISIWNVTDCGMTDDDDDDALCDTSFNGIGYALQNELLDEVTKSAWKEAEDLKKSAVRRTRQNPKE